MTRLCSMAPREFGQQPPVSGDVLQERAAQCLIVDLGRPLLQQAMPGLQGLSGAGVLVGAQNAVSGPTARDTSGARFRGTAFRGPPQEGPARVPLDLGR